MNYKELPDSSRIWIYQSSRELQKEEVDQIKDAGKRFIANWATHGTALQAAMEVFYDRFIVLFADEEQVKASGCSIDSSVHFMKEVEKAFGINLFDRMNIAYRSSNDSINTLPMHDLRELMESGKLNDDTTIFNNLVATKGEMESNWEVPVQNSWLAGV